MNFKIDFIYKVNHAEPLQTPIHQHTCYELVLYIEGHGKVHTDSASYDYKPNHLVIIPPYCNHDEVNYETSCNLVIGFQSDCSDIPLGAFAADGNIVSILHNMLHEKAEHQQYFEEIMSLQLYRVILLILRSTSGETTRNDFSYILRNIDNYISENLSLPISIKDFATMYHYSFDRFRHIFTENTNVSPKQYIICKRLEKAVFFLENTTLSITDIAHNCGFYDVSQFSKMFKCKYSLSPTQYRKQKTSLKRNR